MHLWRKHSIISTNFSWISPQFWLHYRQGILTEVLYPYNIEAREIMEILSRKLEMCMNLICWENHQKQGKDFLVSHKYVENSKPEKNRRKKILHLKKNHYGGYQIKNWQWIWELHNDTHLSFSLLSFYIIIRVAWGDMHNKRQHRGDVFTRKSCIIPLKPIIHYLFFNKMNGLN